MQFHMKFTSCVFSSKMVESYKYSHGETVEINIELFSFGTNPVIEFSVIIS